MRAKTFIFCGIVLGVCILLILQRLLHESKENGSNVEITHTNQRVVVTPAENTSVASSSGLLVNASILSSTP